MIIALFLVATAVLFIWPSTNVPRRSDAIVVLGGAGPRVPKGMALARAGYAPYLVISNPNHLRCPQPPRRTKVICFVPEPSTTQGEARDVAKMAREHNWHQIIVVPDKPQILRARIRFERCFHGTLLLDPAEPAGPFEWVSDLGYEWGALIKTLTLQPGC